MCNAGYSECGKQSADSEPVSVAPWSYDDQNTRSCFCRQCLSTAHEQVNVVPFLACYLYSVILCSDWGLVIQQEAKALGALQIGLLLSNIL